MFTEDPTLPVVVLLMASACCFVALRVRQEGKYLIWGGATLAVAGVVMAFEWLWVTDVERIEGIVYDLRRALLASDSQGILAHLTPDAQFVQSGSSMTPETTRSLITGNVSAAKLDLVRVRGLQASAGSRTRRGKAEFKVFTRGSIQGPLGFGAFSGAADSAWSLGFEETRPGVWKINRITPISTPINPAVFAGWVAPRRPEAQYPGMMDPSLHGPMASDHDRGRGAGEPRMTRKALARERERQLRPGRFPTPDGR
jgi:hypothetical protein